MTDRPYSTHSGLMTRRLKERFGRIAFAFCALSTTQRSSTTAAMRLFFSSECEIATAIAPQLSFNFGSSTGWSYLSAGIGGARWSIVPDGALPTLADEERLKTINYGGGARWFARKHLAFTFDVRFYAINPGTPQFGLPGSPRTRLLVVGAGASVR